ncbi:MAG: hypothetical protein DDT20_01914 [Firmicutes bacterium]|nr:hypothetical protein [Bacillota bacterium]
MCTRSAREKVQQSASPTAPLAQGPPVTSPPSAILWLEGWNLSQLRNPAIPSAPGLRGRFEPSAVLSQGEPKHCSNDQRPPRRSASHTARERRGRFEPSAVLSRGGPKPCSNDQRSPRRSASHTARERRGRSEPSVVLSRGEPKHCSNDLGKPRRSASRTAPERRV